MIRAFNNHHPVIASTAFVSESAVIIGQVRIGEDAGIWPGAVIRADFGLIELGDESQVEDNCVLHAGTDLLIGRCVIIGHGAVVHCRGIGDYVLVGTNATILDEAEIGNYCIVAAGSLVKPGMKIPDYTVVSGVPARVKGKITNKFIERLHAGAKTYKELARQYKKAGLQMKERR